MVLDKKALNIEMLKIAGFTYTGGIWTYPDGVDVDNGVPFFPDDETECFKWLVSKLGDYRLYMSNIYQRVWRIEIYGKGGADIFVENEHLALAFCLAMKELK